jgi:predicted secreted Zn-dependent protease
MASVKWNRHVWRQTRRLKDRTVLHKVGRLRFPGPRMKSSLLALLLSTMLLPPEIALAEWRPVEQEKTYTVSGNSGAELYAAIGEHGPKVGGLPLGAIAHTSFKLTWTRKYEPRDGGCVIAVNRPKLIITYVLPKLAGKPPQSVRQEWETFIEGVRDHEKVHGRMIVEMVKEIEAISVGMSVPNDPDCKAIRQELTRRLAEISQNQRRRSRDFDKVELSEGGNIHQLILRLVNGS